MSTKFRNPVCRWRFGGMLLLLVLAIVGTVPGTLAHAAAANGAQVLPPVPPGMARIWIYRDYEPFLSLARPYVRLNGAVTGISEPGGAFYRDVAAGAYAVTVDSDGTDTNQFVTVAPSPGQQVFIKVLVDPYWASGGGGSHSAGYQRDTFYTWWIPPQAALAEMAQLPVYNGG